MKTLLFAATCLATCLAHAATPVEGGNVATLIEVEYAKQNLYTLIAVPVAGLDIAGAGEAKSLLDTLLPPENYPVGTSVYFYTAGTYYSWEVETSEGSNVWKPINYVPAGDGGDGNPSPAADKHDLVMGNALWLKLPALPTGDDAISTHLAGQVASLTSVTVGAEHNLVAFGGADAVPVSKITIQNPVTGTKGNLSTLYRIFLPDENGKNISLAFNNEKWYNTSTGKEIDDTVLVLPGKGLWFINPHGETTIFVNTDAETETP